MTSLSFTDNFFLSTSFVVWITQVPGRLADNRRQWIRSFLFTCFQGDNYMYIYIENYILKKEKGRVVNLNFYARKKNNFPKLINLHRKIILNSFRNHPSSCLFFVFILLTIHDLLFIFTFPLFLFFLFFFF